MNNQEIFEGAKKINGDIDSVVENARGNGNVFSVSEVIKRPPCITDLADKCRQSGVGSLKVLEVYDTKNKNSREIIGYGEDNCFPQILCELLHTSPLHKSITMSKVNLAYGGGIVVYDENGEEATDAMEFLKTTGLKDLDRDLIWDMAVFNGFAVQLKHEITSDAKRRVSFGYRHSFEDIRLSNPKRNKYGIFTPHEAWISLMWNKNTRSVSESNEYIKVPLYFEEQDMREYSTMGTNMYYGCLKTPLTKFYPVPDYYSKGAMDAIRLDSELISFDVHEVINQLTSGYVVTFIRKNYAEEDPNRERELRQKEQELVEGDMTGSENNKRVVIMRAEPPPAGSVVKDPMQVTALPNNNTGDRHNILSNRKNIYILVAHGLQAPEIAGIPNLGKSGFTNEDNKIKTSTEGWFFTRINDLRRPIVEFYERMLTDAGIDFGKIEYKNVLPFDDVISDTMWRHAFLENEFREAVGYGALSDDELQSLREVRGALGQGKRSSNSIQETSDE